MIRINQLKLPVGHPETELKKRAAKMLRLPPDKIRSIRIVRQSLDARKKENLQYIYAVDAEIHGNEGAAVKRAASVNVTLSKEEAYTVPEPGEEPLSERPVIVGFGPAGMFCGLLLARAGYRPLILERGDAVEERTRRVREFWDGGPLDTESNVQFGEGGAGTFSDGKLNTLVKDPSGRNQEVLRILAQAGADPAILYVNKPHVGTDVLKNVVRHIREEILSLGGEIRFRTRFADFETDERGLCAVYAEKNGIRERIPARVCVLAPGHSARDTFAMLDTKGLEMEPKSFAVGIRIQHPQTEINRSQYGMEDPGELGAASYKVTHQCRNGRGVYSFCMCPGGYVVNASSEPGRLAVNGMSNHDRAGRNANSALIVTVTPEDFPVQTALGGVEFQRQLEEKAFRCGNGRIPVQLFEDFRKNRISEKFGEVTPEFEGLYQFGNLREVLPEAVSESLEEGILAFGRRIQGFDRPDALMAGVESRTSSPLRIPRDRDLQSLVKGLYPIGEGAGYAGGITSAAMDGMKAAEAVISRYAPAHNRKE